MEKQDLISVVVPIYKAENFLEKCINSITNQTYKNLEIILVDDGSPDSCPKMCDAFAKKDKRIKVIHKPNGGVSSARNAGLENATGKYVCFVDSDDEVRENYCERLHSAITEQNVDLVICSIFNDATQKISGPDHNSIINIKKEPEKLKDIYTGYEFLCPFNKIYVRSKIKNFFSTNTSYGEDELFNLDYCLNCETIYIISDDLYIYYTNENSLVNTNKINLYKKRASLTKQREHYFNILFDGNKKYVNYCSTCYLINQIGYTIGDFIKNNRKMKAIIGKIKEICENPDVQYALTLYVPDSKKNKFIYKCLTKKRYFLLAFVYKLTH